ncbi:hypothetical protein [Streptomyces prasinopilosus]|uniref:hypothetical protein n=1 Tax=Streptomyces prasinopilosus TaxID=67344 RepID=UPI0006EB372E|nr:hypothetical protein [Streptomyces prasinopilosus]
MTDQTADDLTEPDNPTAWALARHIADHPVSTIQAAFRYLNAPLTIEVREPASAAGQAPATDQTALRDHIAEALLTTRRTDYEGKADHRQHRYDARCALCAYDVDALANAVMAVLPAPTAQEPSIPSKADTASADESPHIYMTAIRQQAAYVHEFTKAGRMAEALEHVEAMERLLAVYRRAVRP